jgi:hypothetical protein
MHLRDNLITIVVLLCACAAVFSSCQANGTVPSEPVFGNESIFKTASTPIFSSGTVDTSSTVTNYTSIAIDPDDNYPAIAYYDSSGANLMYAKWDGSDWDDKVTVDSSGDVGKFASLAFDSSGNPSIGYYDDTNDALKWAYDDDDDGDWNEGDWPMTLADNANDDFGKYCSHNISGSSFGFAFYKANTTDLLYYEYDIVTSNTSQVDVDSGNDVGKFSSLKFHSGVPGISYYDATNGNLKYATEGSPYWNVQTVDSTGDVGQYSSLDYDGSGNPSIAYYNNNTPCGYACWARWDSVRSRWYIASLVGGTGEDWGQYISHQWYGNTKCGLAFLAEDANGSWLEFVLWTPGGGGGNYVADSTADCGMNSSFAWVTAGGNDGDGWISHYDSTNGDLRYAFVND